MQIVISLLITYPTYKDSTKMQYLTLVEPFMYYNKLAVLPSRIIADCSDLNETVVSLCYIIHRLEYELQMKC